MEINSIYCTQGSTYQYVVLVHCGGRHSFGCDGLNLQFGRSHLICGVIRSAIIEWRDEQELCHAHTWQPLTAHDVANSEMVCTFRMSVGCRLQKMGDPTIISMPSL
ncbi:hypothetical protein CC2G_010687 [Coprinopsis cinerea AmutBmut pab1-1]|nr:hypothetical protein CC2G_010687 [Coprinopsis cinerea AmutBmut pab1-1]